MSARNSDVQRGSTAWSKTHGATRSSTGASQGVRMRMMGFMGLDSILPWGRD